MTPADGASPSSHAHGGERDGHVAYDKHAGHSVEMFRRKFWGTLLLSIPTVLWAPMIQHWLGYEAGGGSTASRFIPALFGTLVLAYRGWVFVKGAIGELADRRPGMMTLIALAISVAFVFSLAVTFGFPGMDLWWELATLVTIMVLGHWIEMRSISKAQGALGELAKLLPDRPFGSPTITRRSFPHPLSAKATSRWFARARAFRPTASCETPRAK
jgi:Cu2+-exporting ATPase